MYALVLIQYTNKLLDKTFTYLIPSFLMSKIKVGMKVYVPFNNQNIMGLVLDITNKYEGSYELKYILDIVDEELILNKELLDIGKYLKETTLCSLMSAYQGMLPSSLKIRKQKTNYNLYDTYIYLKDKEESLKYLEKYPRRIAQGKIIKDLLDKEYLLKKDYSSSLINTLINEGILGTYDKIKYRINKEKDTDIKELTIDQKKVYDAINFDTYNTYLLYGVTGSGKTQVYINLVAKCLKLGKTAIVLVPEISLTTQIAKRFYSCFGSDVAILHSSLSQGEKYDEYLKIYRGEVKVVVGTRSAIFAPLANIGLIIIDEEDSHSYKQEVNVKYHARDVAIYRCKYKRIPLVLGSATPSLESKARADKNVYKLLTLDKRVNNLKLPLIHLVDMKSEMKKGNMIFSDLLKEKMNKALSKQEQVILLLNRRGFSTFITCSNCGFTYKCPDCEITLTYHKSSNNLICHYCGYIKKKDDVCPKCREEALNYYGMGTEKLEEEVKMNFPLASVIRMDQDTTRNKGMHEKIIDDFQNNKYNVLIGTQMVSKGLDFNKVTLVGVINADTTLNIPDFRASENTFSLLLQTSGRAGRRKGNGEVIIQTFNKDHYVLRCVKDNNYDLFYRYEMNFRHTLKYPPYFYLVSLKVIGKDYLSTLTDSKEVKEYLTKYLDKSILVLGPTTSSVLKYKNEYRMQIIIKYKKEYNLKQVLNSLNNLNLKSRIDIDFNPLKI